MVHTVPTEPGLTLSLLPAGADAEFFTAIVRYPVVSTDAITFGTMALIALARPATVLLGANGTATSMLLTLNVSPAVNEGLVTAAVILP